MSTLNITLEVPSTITGLSITAAIGGVTLKWVASTALTDQYEVWYNTSNTTTGATNLATIESNHYTSTNLDVANTYYFWVRTINAVGTVGAWPSSVTTSQQLIASANTSAPSSVTSAGVSAGSTSSSPTISAYATWYSFGYGSFTASDNSIITVSLSSAATISSVTSTSGQILTVYSRTRLYDVTTAADVPGGIKQYVMYRNFAGNIIGTATPLVSTAESYISGFRGLLIPGHSYQVHMEWMMEQTLSTPTGTLAKNFSAVVNSGSASMS